MNYLSRTGVSAPRPPAPIIALIIIFGKEGHNAFHGEHILGAGGRGMETTVLLGGCIRLDKIKAWYIIISSVVYSNIKRGI